MRVVHLIGAVNLGGGIDQVPVGKFRRERNSQ